MARRFYETLETWLDKKILVDSINEQAKILFAGHYKYESLWTWLGFLSDEMDEVGWWVQNRSVGNAFRQSVVSALPWNDLESLLDILTNMVGQLSVKETTLLSVLDNQQIVKLDLLNENDVVDTRVLRSISETDFNNLYAVYSAIKAAFLYAGAALLFFTPSETAYDVTYYEKDAKSIFDDLTPQSCRYIGHMCIAETGEMRDNAVKFLLNNNKYFDFDNFSVAQYISYAAALHAGFQSFSVLDTSVQDKILEKHFVNAFRVGAPVMIALKKYLAALTDINEYGVRSASLFKLLSNSGARLGQTATAQSFAEWFRVYQEKYGDNDINETNQLQYCELTFKNGNLSALTVFELKVLLSAVIDIREGVFVDYRGILAESGLAKNVPDWKMLLENGITQEQAEIIYTYFLLLRRPLWNRINLQVIANKLDWQNEPYISNLLKINELYSLVHNEPFSPVVLWDSVSQNWVFNDALPTMWAKESVADLLKKESTPLFNLPGF